jgi:hypothetical protein
MSRRCLSAAALASASLLGLSITAFAQTGPDLLIKPFPANRSVEADAAALYLPDSDTSNADADFSLTSLEAQGRFRLLRDNAARPVGGFAATQLLIDTDDPAIPENLGDYSLGAGIGLFAQSGWVGGVTFALGHASDSPFSDGNAWYGKATLVVGKDNVWDGWGVGLAIEYNGNRTFRPDLPLPGFVFTKRFHEIQSVVTVGIPVTGIRWTPSEQWEVILNYLFPDFVDAKVTFFPTRGLGIYGSVGQQTYAFWSDTLADSNDRIFYRQRRAELGVEWKPSDNVAVVLSGGYAFSQEITAGWDRDDDVLLADVDDAPYARLSMTFAY